MLISDHKKARNISFLIIQIVFGIRLIYGTIDNVLSWQRMLEFSDFLEGNGFPFPLESAIISVWLQFLCGISWIIGFKVKWTAATMALNFLVAVVFVHLINGDTYLQTAPALHLLVVSVVLMLTGGSEYGLRSIIGENRK
ncbi:MAG: DoxX family protein [Cyclobacteriaceae bacterium]